MSWTNDYQPGDEIKAYHQGNWKRGAGYRYDLRDARGSLVATDITRTDFSAVVPLLSTSYGLNLRAVTQVAGTWDWPAPTETILLLDYPKPECMLRVTCLCNGQSRPVVRDDWSVWTNSVGQYSFARHNERCNVLFASGRVEAFKPQDIDPNVSRNLTNYWLPK